MSPTTTCAGVARCHASFPRSAAIPPQSARESDVLCSGTEAGPGFGLFTDVDQRPTDRYVDGAANGITARQKPAVESVERGLTWSLHYRSVRAAPAQPDPEQITLCGISVATVEAPRCFPGPRLVTVLTVLILVAPMLLTARDEGRRSRGSVVTVLCGLAFPVTWLRRGTWWVSARSPDHHRPIEGN